MKLRAAFIVLVLLFGAAGSASAWAGPPYNGVCNPSPCPPGGNVPAPLNVGSTNQTKNANLGLNGLAVFGNSILQASSYLNWGSTSGSSGYGIRDSAGTLQFKNSGGSWASLQSLIYSLVGSTSPWTISGSSIYYSGGNVLIGTNSYFNIWNNSQSLEVAGTGAAGMSISAASNAATPAIIAAIKSRGTTAGDLSTAVQSGDNLLTISSKGADGSSNGSAAGQITFAVDGAVSSGVVPGRILFRTADTSGALREVMRINSAGNVGVGITSPLYQLDLNGGSGASKGIRFPDGTVQTSAAGSSIATAVGPSGTINTGTEANLGANWSVIFLSVQMNTGGGDSSTPVNFIFKENGVPKAQLTVGQNKGWFVDPITTTSVCGRTGSSAPSDSNDLCVRMVGNDVYVRTGTQTRVTYLKIQ